MTARIGYVRVSSRDQNLDSQYDMLEQAACQKIFVDTVCGVAEHRPEWEKLMEYVRSGDTIVVAELSRMTRSLMHLLHLSQEFQSKGINLVSLREAIRTSEGSGLDNALLLREEGPLWAGWGQVGWSKQWTMWV